MTIKNGSQTMDFKKLLFNFLSQREGYETQVYRDIYGNPTVGIGHLITTSDNLTVGQHISKEKVEEFFYKDYDRLKIEKYVTEANWNSNQMLAIASFVWGHGDGQYKTSTLRDMLMSGGHTETAVLNYLQANWDIKKPKNQLRNKRDFQLYFSNQPWQGGSLFFYNWVELTDNDISGYILSGCVPPGDAQPLQAA